MPTARYNTGARYNTPGLVYAPAAVPPTKGRTLMKMPVDDAIGYAQQARELLTNYKTDMTATGVDPTVMIAALATKAGNLTTKNQEQEAAKTLLRNLTTEVETMIDEAARAASQACDMVIGAFGKADERSREATKLRKSVNPKRSPDDEEPPPSNP